MTTSPRPRRRMFLVVALVLLLVSAGAVGFWTWDRWSQRTAADVHAAWGPVCEKGTRIGRHEGQPAIHAKPGWRCTIRLTIDNHSGRDVRITSIEGAFMGTGGGAEVQGFSTADGRIHDVDRETGRASGHGDIDAAWDVDIALRPGESRTVKLAIGWREQGCNALPGVANSAGHWSLEAWPKVTVEVLGRTHRFSPEQDLVLRTFDDAHDEEQCR